MKTKAAQQAAILFQSVRDYYGTQESLECYSDRARRVGLFPPERAMVKRFMRPPARVLDVGCGAGREALALARMGFTVTGVDITPALLEEARRIAVDRALSIDFRLADGTTLEFSDGGFDYVLLITQMIHHVPGKANRVRLLREAGRVARAEGRILLTYHDWDIEKDHAEWGWTGGHHCREPGPGESPETCRPLEPGDHFTRDCQGTLTGVFGFAHHFARGEIESEVVEAGLRIVARSGFETIAGGEPDDFWKPTQILVLAASSTPPDNEHAEPNAPGDADKPHR